MAGVASWKACPDCHQVAWPRGPDPDSRLQSLQEERGPRGGSSDEQTASWAQTLLLSCFSRVNKKPALHSHSRPSRTRASVTGRCRRPVPGWPRPHREVCPSCLHPALPVRSGAGGDHTLSTGLGPTHFFRAGPREAASQQLLFHFVYTKVRWMLGPACWQSLALLNLSPILPRGHPFLKY